MITVAKKHEDIVDLTLEKANFYLAERNLCAAIESLIEAISQLNKRVMTELGQIGGLETHEDEGPIIAQDSSQCTGPDCWWCYRRVGGVHKGPR